MKDNHKYNEDFEYELEQELKDLYKPSKYEKKRVRNKMKNKNKRFLKVAAVAACLVVALPFTSMGQEFYTIIKKAVLPSGRIEIIEEESNVDEKNMAMPLPKGYEGEVFDKDGNPLTKLKANDRIYNKDGQEIVGTSTIEGSDEVEFYTEEDMKKEEEKSKDARPINMVVKERLNFKPLILPEQYQYEYSEIFTENNEKTDYANFFFKTKDGRDILLFERVSSEKAGYVIGGKEIKEIKVDGVDIIFHDGDTFEFERDGVLMTLMVRNSNYEELLKIYKDLYIFK